MSRAARRLRKINNEMGNRLDPKDLDAMRGIVNYLQSTGLTAVQREEVRRDIIDMLIDGRRRGQSASDVIGGDYRAFCDEIVAAVAPVSLLRRTVDWIAMLFAALAMMSWIMLVISVVDAMKHDMLPDVPIQVGMLVAFVIYAVFAVVMVRAFTRHIFDLANIFGSMNWCMIVLFVVWVLVLVIGTAASTFVTASFTVPVAVLAMAVGVLAVCAVLLDYFN